MKLHVGNSHHQVVVVQSLQTNVQKILLHVQSCCFDNLNLFSVFFVLVAVAFAIVES